MSAFEDLKGRVLLLRQDAALMHRRLYSLAASLSQNSWTDATFVQIQRRGENGHPTAAFIVAFMLSGGKHDEGIIIQACVTIW